MWVQYSLHIIQQQDSVQKNIDVRYHFVQDLIEERIIEITFVKTLENDADVYTKNTCGELFQKHTGKYMEENEYNYESTSQQEGC
jgi:hypothetical protein